jgi:hypothetical protein
MRTTAPFAARPRLSGLANVAIGNEEKVVGAMQSSRAATGLS